MTTTIPTLDKSTAVTLSSLFPAGIIVSMLISMFYLVNKTPTFTARYAITTNAILCFIVSGAAIWTVYAYANKPEGCEDAVSCATTLTIFYFLMGVFIAYGNHVACLLFFQKSVCVCVFV